MADFCRQCSLQIFREDFRDLAGITEMRDGDGKLVPRPPGSLVLVICEGCGPALVDMDGVCHKCIEGHAPAAPTRAA